MMREREIETDKVMHFHRAFSCVERCVLVVYKLVRIVYEDGFFFLVDD